jgi:hypothetical protein
MGAPVNIMDEVMMPPQLSQLFSLLDSSPGRENPSVLCSRGEGPPRHGDDEAIIRARGQIGHLSNEGICPFVPSTTNYHCHHR